MPYMMAKRNGTPVEALGFAAKADTMYYASFIGPTQAAKAVWSRAVEAQSTAIAFLQWNWSVSSYTPYRPLKVYSVKVRASNYTHYVMRPDDPSFLLVTDKRLLMIEELHRTTKRASNGKTDQFSHILDIAPEFATDEIRTLAQRQWGNDATDAIKKKMQESPETTEALAQQLVTAMNKVTDLPIPRQWGATLWKELPEGSYTSMTRWGEVVAAIRLEQSFNWQDWVTGLMRTKRLKIPAPTLH